MKIFMLTGKAGAGKDTAYGLIAHLLKDKLVLREAFADSLKSIAKSLTWDGVKDEKGRRFLQDLGKVARAYNKDVWAKMVACKITFKLADIIVITDWRFPNELDVLRKYFPDIVTVRITGRQTDLGENSKDVSEHSLDHFVTDYTISNDSDLDSFKDNLKAMLIQQGLI